MTATVDEARNRADQARDRMVQTLHEIQRRIAPSTLAREAWDGAKSKGADLAEDAVDVVRNRPVAATGVVAAVAMFLAREPLMGLVERMWSGKSRHGKPRHGKPGHGKPKPGKRSHSLEGSQETMETVE